MRFTIDSESLRSWTFRTNTSKLVWFCLIRDANDYGIVETSIRRIAKEIGVNEKSVRNILAELNLSGVTESINPHLSPQQSPRLGTCLKLLNIDECRKKTKTKSAPKSAAESDITTAKSSSDTLSFVDPAFADCFAEWLDFKKRQFKFEYKTEHSLRAAYNELLRLSGADPVTAAKIVEQSESHGWKGLFKLQDNEQKPIITADNAATRKASRDRMVGLANGVLSQSADKLARLYYGSGENSYDSQNQK